MFNNIVFIMVEPKTAGNIGAACRAIKTMGFSQLRLVNPGADLSNPEAEWMAHGAEDILKNIRIYESIPSAIEDLHWTVGTSNRERGLKLPYFTAEQMAQKAVPIAQDHKIGFLFGRERTGLTNEELYYCNAISYIPAHTKNPSLNLAQAIQVFAYELFKHYRGNDKKYKLRHASQEEIQHLYLHLRKMLHTIEFVPKDNMDTFIMRFQRWFGRSEPEVRDVKVLHMIFKSVEEYVAQLKKSSAGETDDIK
ncbi:MAG: RNA methyltransferase [Calditrichia bacterium]